MAGGASISSGLAWVNGAFLPIEDAKVSVEDRGFQFGDSVYEVVVTYDGRLFQLDSHLQRLRSSADAIGLEYDFARRPLEPIIEEGLRRCALADALVYIQLSRGAAPRSHTIPKEIEPTLVVTFRARKPVPSELRDRGVALVTVPDTRWTRCFIKAVTLLPNVLAKTEAVRRGYYDALFVTSAGEVRESTAANVFFVREGAITTPPRDESVLHGITQSLIMECADGLNIPLTERVIRRDDLHGVEEAFLSSTTVEVLAVTSIDDHAVGDGKVGSITRRIAAEFRRLTRAVARTPDKDACLKAR